MWYAMQRPADDEHRVTRWAAWVSAGTDRAERAARLAEVPEPVREYVRQEVVWLYARGRPPYRSSDSVHVD